METFAVNLHLRIITTSDDAKLLILLDDNGEIPKIALSKSSAIDSQILDKLKELLYENDIYNLFSTKQVSSINNSIDTVDIFYNFFSISDKPKSGSFVLFNKNSIELYRMVHNHTS